MKKTWPFTFNLLFFGGFAFVAPFLVPYYRSLGLDGVQIGLLTGITPLVTMAAATFWTGLADSAQRHKLIMSTALIGGILALLIFPFISAFLLILGIAVIFNIFFGPVTSLADSAAMHMLGAGKEHYGRIRLGGTLGFGLMAPLAGWLIMKYGLNLAFWGAASMFSLALMVSWKLVHNPAHRTAFTGGKFRPLLTDRRWIIFLTIALLGGAAVPMQINYFYPYLRELGADEALTGIALMHGTLLEIPIFFLGSRLLKRFGSYPLLVFAMVMSGVRLILFGLAATPASVLVIQFASGFVFPAMWLVGVTYADENAPPGLSATAQGLFAAMIFGFGSAVGGIAGGLLLEGVGGRGMNMVFGIILLAALALIIPLGGRGMASPPAPVFEEVSP